MTAEYSESGKIDGKRFTVQRGEIIMNEAIINITIAAVDMSESMVNISQKPLLHINKNNSYNSYAHNYIAGGALTSPTNLRLEANGTGTKVFWEVIESV